MYSYLNENGDECIRHASFSYTVKDLKEVLEECNDDDEVLVCVDLVGEDGQIFPDKKCGSIYKSHDLLVIDIEVPT